MKTLSALWESLRPYQWTKNLIILAALIFSQRLTDGPSVQSAVVAAAVFCLLAGCVYILNDLHDLDSDRQHPEKSQRPIAQGRLQAGHARVAVLAILLVVAGVSWRFLPGSFLGIAAVYFVLNVWYTRSLKKIAIIDVMVLAMFYVIRAVAGGLAIAVSVSPWLLICTFLLALFLGFSKRRHELTSLAGQATAHRVTLSDYSPVLLDQMISIVTAMTVMSYVVYTVSEDAIHNFGTANLVYTVPFVLYGIFRYLTLVHMKDRGGNPSKIMITDRALIFNNIAWIISVILIIYGPF